MRGNPGEKPLNELIEPWYDRPGDLNDGHPSRIEATDPNPFVPPAGLRDMVDSWHDDRENPVVRK